LHNIPNIISVLRILLVLPIAHLLLDEAWKSALILIFIAGISDAFDGFLARAFHWQSKLGSILDPLADKLLLVVLFVTLAYQNIIPNWLAFMVIARDIIILLGAITYQWLTKDLKIAPLLSSKINTALQIVFVLGLMYHLAISPLSQNLLLVMQILIVMTTLYSGVIYIICWLGYYKKFQIKQADKIKS